MTKKVTLKQHLALGALLTEADVSKAAEAAAVSRTTIYRWLKDPVFQNALNAAESEALAALSRKLVVLGSQAACVLDDAMRDANTPVSVRLRAADIVLSRLLQLRELVQLDTRVTEIELRLGIQV